MISSVLANDKHYADIDEIAHVAEIKSDKAEIAEVTEIRPCIPPVSSNNFDTTGSDEIPVEVINDDRTAYITTAGIYESFCLPAKYSLQRKTVNDILLDSQHSTEKTLSLGTLLSRIWNDAKSRRRENIMFSRPVPILEYGGQQIPPAVSEGTVPVTFESSSQISNPKPTTKSSESAATRTQDFVDENVSFSSDKMKEKHRDPTVSSISQISYLAPVIEQVLVRSPTSSVIQMGDIAHNIKEVWS